jgi:hypothetical protein
MPPRDVTADVLAAALASAGYEPPHARVAMLRPPFRLHEGDLALPELAMRTGTLVVIGTLTVAGSLELQRDSRPLANVIVVGSCELGIAYVDGFLVVRDELRANVLIADASWDGGVFVGGDLHADTLAIHNTAMTIHGTRHARVLADTERAIAAQEALPALFQNDDAEPYGYFLGLVKR